MNARPLALPEVLLVEPTVFADARGAFFESYNARAFSALVGREVSFVQDNHSVSGPGVLRGLHCQVAPFAQAKLVRVVAGEIFDVAVDLRRSSPTYGQWAGARLSAANRLQLYIPEGFAHGFVVIGPGAEVLYKATTFYEPAAERTLRWDDPAIGIDWPLTGAPVLSARDADAEPLGNAVIFE